MDGTTKARRGGKITAFYYILERVDIMITTTLSSGHGKYVAGASYYIDEVTEARKVVDRVKAISKEIGKGVINTFHENEARSKTDNVNKIVRHHNNTTRDLDVSIHFNSASFSGSKCTDNAVGIETLYYSESGKSHAKALNDKMAKATGLKNRGIKKRDNLGFLKKTNKPAILVEVCFVNSKADVDLYKANFEKLCIAIAEYLTGGVYKPVVEVKPAEPTNSSYVVRITADVLNVRTGAGTNYPISTKVKKGGVYTIVETKNGWGRLKSGAGWISLSYTEKK